jgi:hypothetical protein
MTAAEVIDRVRITHVVEALGGKVRQKRCQAFWRKGDGPNVSLADDKGAWFDHARGEGGGVLDLVQRIRGCDRKEALQWLADFAGVPLENGRNEHGRRDYLNKRHAAEAEARALVKWRNRLEKKWQQLRKEYFGVYHDARRLILEVGLDSDAGRDAADAYEIAEVRYQVLDSVLSVMQAASWHDLLPIFRGQKRSVAT